MKWADGPMLGFDLETTGVDVWTDRIVTATIVEIRMGQRPKITNWLANPGIEIPEEAAAIHGITTEHAREHGRDPGEVTFEVSAKLAYAMSHGIPVVGANMSFDMTLLEEENRRHGNPTLAERVAPKPIGPLVDVQVLDKAMDPYRPSKCDGNQKRPPRCTCGATDKTVSSLVKHYGVILAGAHTSDGDALAACRLFPRILARHKELQAYPIGALHQAQVRWRAQQQNSLREYFDKKGEPHDGCNGGWPLRTDRPALEEAS